MADTTTRTLDRTQRDALRYEIVAELDGGSVLSFVGSDAGNTREHLAVQRARLDALLRALDELGWDTSDDRRTFTMTIDEPLRDSFAKWLKGIAASLEDDHRDLMLARQGDKGRWPCDARHMGEVETSYAREIGHWERQIAALEEVC